MKIIRLAVALLCAASFPAAQAADLALKADYWDYDVQGSVMRDGDVQDLESDLGVRAREHWNYSLAWNTGPGWWRPDLAASYSPLDAGGERRVDRSIRFGPVVIPAESTARGSADLKDFDLTLRYPARWHSLAFWGGVTLKRISGEVLVESAADGSTDRESIDQVFPMLHVAAHLPASSWLALSAQGNAIRYGDNNAYEWRAGVSLGLLGPLGFNLGWQSKHYRIDDGSYRLDATLSGAIAGVVVTLR